jgi:single-stranded-DNA-specific exonuclease
VSGILPKRTWRVAGEDRRKTAALAEGLGVPRIVAHILATRGVTTVAEGKSFLEPRLTDIVDPFSLTDMQAALDRIETARARNDPVLVFGDYDVDGIAGTAILLNGLRRYGIPHCAPGMPSRLIEGYGINPEHVTEAHRSGFKLIITVDNGINARDAAAAAHRLGLDLIVTDHHQIEGDLPEAAAVVNPKREGGSFPSAHASGAAVAFHVARALTGAVEDLDLVALGTVADIVPLRGENRALAALGLAEMVRRRRVGLVQLALAAGSRIEEVTAEKIAFQLAPRLNAAGRLGAGLGPLELLLTDSVEDAARLARDLNRANEERRDIEGAILDDALEEIEATLRPDASSIVLARRGWHPGVIGIVASRLYATYHRPVVLVALDEQGLGRGSARSGDDFGMVAALGACRGHLARFGGHSAAAGLTIPEQNLPGFRAAFEEEATRRLESREPIHVLDVDALISLSEIDAQLVTALDRLEPYGCMNPGPVFCTYGVTALPYSTRELRGGHLRFTVQQGPKAFEAVGFRMSGLLEEDIWSGPLDIAFSPKFNTWRGETTVQLVLKDVQGARK